jgi:hypothetical protein
LSEAADMTRGSAAVTGESVALNSINAEEGQVHNIFVRTDFLLIRSMMRSSQITDTPEGRR